MTNETKDARIERLLGLLGQAQQVMALIINAYARSGWIDQYLINEAEIVVAKIRKEREA